MPNSPDDPASSSEGAAPTAAPERHLVCAYSPRWLSGPTPSFEGLVATWSPTGDPEPARPAAD